MKIEQKVFQAFANGLYIPLVRSEVRSQNNNEIGMRIRQLYFSAEFEVYTLDNDKYKEIEYSSSGQLVKQ